MSMTEIYALDDMKLLDACIVAMRVPGFAVTNMRLRNFETNKQSEAWIILEALDWLEVRSEYVSLTYDKKNPSDRVYLLRFSKATSFGETRFQAVLRAVLIKASVVQSAR